MTIQIPDDLARDLAGLAAAQRISLEQLAEKQLRSLVARPRKPAEILRRLRSLPHPSPEAVDDLERAIAEGQLPVVNDGPFDSAT